ncbi:MAG: aldehyde dehydrogenase family protein, partial [Anaerolineales bacterium]|nr:aldehyde dehydrogenase family protein [Anaerolineales bacterium]
MSELISRNPATGEELGRAPIYTAEQVQAAVRTARAAQIAWGALSVQQRLRELKRLSRVLVEQADAIAHLIVSEQGKNQIEAYGEVMTALELLRFYQQNAVRILRPRSVSPRLGALRSHRIIARPRGVVGIISPWNYPVTLSMEPLIAALVAGNAVVLKPSEYTPLIGLKIGELARLARLPEGLVQVTTGDASTGQALIAAGIDKLVFTGSAANGRKVAASAGEHLVPLTLELGGKDAAIVLADADLEQAAEGILWGALLNAGQACLAVERIYVEEAVAEAFIQKLTEKAARLRVGPAADPNHDVCAITTEAQLNVIKKHLEDARLKGARVLLGGEPLPAPGRFFPPTILVGVNEEMDVLR